MTEGALPTRTRFWFGALLSSPRRPVAPPRLLASKRAPHIALAVIIAFSLGARLYGIKQPCYTPCSSQFSELIFDEAYYVNAAESIAGNPQTLGSPYLKTTFRGGLPGFVSPPAGDDPNPAHPQLAKVAIAGGIKLFGNGPLGWRLGSVLFSLIAMGAMYALVTGAGGSPWLAVGTVAVMALDNLMLVQGRIAMLDIYALAMMLVAGAFYVRRRPLLAGVALGIGACMKEVAFFLLVALVLFEAISYVQNRQDGTASPIDERPAAAIGGLAGCVLCTFATFFLLLWGLDVLVPAWGGPHMLYNGSPFTHFAHIVKGGASVTSDQFQHVKSGVPVLPGAHVSAGTHHPKGHVAAAVKNALLGTHRPENQAAAASITSTPLQWLIDQRPIQYAEKALPIPGGRLGASGLAAGNVEVSFRAEINPFIIFLALPALALAIAQAWRTRDQVALVGAAWSVGVFLPFLLQSAVLHRISYLYYMLIVLPGVYLMTARLFSWRYVPRLATVVWAGLLVFGFIHLYPIRSFP